jgi:uncharacterized protein
MCIMLRNSFCCFRGVSEAAERALWRDGCLEWRFLPLAGRTLSTHKRQLIMDQVPEMQTALEGRLAGYFLSRLPPGHRLRVWPEFHNSTLFLDIETTGLQTTDEITVIGAWQNGAYSHYVRGVNLERFLEVAGRAQLLITFNGRRFDWPVIERTFGCSLPIPHIDLMHEARVHGYSGGLKAIEPRLGVLREGTEKGDGLLAVTLWGRYRETGDQTALEHLLRYNACDVTSLVVLARKLFQLSVQHYPGPACKPP